MASESSASKTADSPKSDSKTESLSESSRVKVLAGSSLTRVDGTSNLGQNTWCRIPATTFSVRCGPNYKKMKKKGPSLAHFYNCVAVDIFRAPEGKLNHLCQNIRFPEPDSADDDEPEPTENGNADQKSPSSSNKASSDATSSSDAKEKDGAKDSVPNWLILNFQIPTYEPSNPLWGAAKEDGEGFSVVLYFSLRASARKLLRGPSSDQNPALKLLQAFFSAPLDGHNEWKKRLKAIPRLYNSEDLDLNYATRQLVNNYNAKPFMTGPRCHTFYQTSEYVEVDVDVHRFCWAARRGAYSLLDQVEKMGVDLGFVVEATSDEEMPEQLLGCVRVSRMELSAAKTLANWLEREKKKASENDKKG